MATTTFVDGQTVIEAAWLNDVDEAVYNPASVVMPASSVVNTPAGNIAATDVQAAINELDSEKQPLDNELTALATATAAADKIPYFTGATTAGTLTWNSASALANGATTISSNTVIKAAVDAMDIDTQVAPSTSGNVLTSNGTIWTSAAPQGIITTATPQATTTGTSFDFSSIPSTATRITIIFDEVSLSSTDDILVQIGDAGGIEDTIYVSTGISAAGAGTGVSSSTSGFIIRSAAAGSLLSGTMTLVQISSNRWISDHVCKGATTYANYGGGSKTLSATLTSVRIKATGANTFDGGAVNISYE